MAMDDTGFMNDEEKEDFYIGQSHIDEDKLGTINHLKVYEGADFLQYYWTEEDKIQIVSSYMVTDISVFSGRMWVTFMDKQSYRLFKVGNIPVKVGGYNVAIAVPVRVTVEKTMKKTRQKGYVVEGLTIGMKCYLCSDPSDEIPNHPYLIPQNQMHSILPAKQLREALEEVSDGR